MKELEKPVALFFPSDYEGISNSMIEAMALGLPTISTDYPSGGARDMIITGENGWLVPVGNSEKMSAIMCEIIENNEKTLEIGRNAVEIRDKLNVNKIRTIWIDYIKRCI